MSRWQRLCPQEVRLFRAKCVHYLKHFPGQFFTSIRYTFRNIRTTERFLRARPIVKLDWEGRRRGECSDADSCPDRLTACSPSGTPPAASPPGPLPNGFDSPSLSPSNHPSRRSACPRRIMLIRDGVLSPAVSLVYPTRLSRFGRVWIPSRSAT
ncbi:hypothetical protein BKA70DRAFT_731027 [Coprinopsis sp. MPI-PUGE-AT-0042]|nr:hypothetical protein BKA70DRAFT_731027 [Coprinopsis sp. MPI-PUGE-AT-0042]